MTKYRYILEPYKGMETRHVCPDCKKPERTFVRYIDTQTGKHVHPAVGRCNREDRCGYHYTPKEFFEDNPHIGTRNDFTAVDDCKRESPKPISFIDHQKLKDSLESNIKDHFVDYLRTLFSDEIVSRLRGATPTAETERFSPYFIGTSGHWPGATVFWQIDIAGKIRTGKIMLYDENTGKRVKHPFNRIAWVHSTPPQPDYNLKQCFFGEHLLKDDSKPVAIVESEKTAVIASVYLPEFIWLACGGLTNLNAEKCRVLKGRRVVLFPDLNGYEKWKAKAKELSGITKFTVSDLLERKATDRERENGLDLADYLVRFDLEEFALF